MAHMRKNFIIGVLGPLVFRELNGKNIVSTRVAKGKIKHTKNTKTVSNTFGMATKLAGHILGCFKDSLNDCQDPLLFRRLSRLLQQVFLTTRDIKTRLYSFELNSFRSLNSLDFTIKSPLESSLINDPVVNLAGDQMSVFVSGLDNPEILVYPKGCFTCEITVSLAFFQMAAGLKIANSENQRVMLKKNTNDISEHEFVFQVPAGCLCIASIILNFFSIKRNYTALINTKEFNPSAICAAFIMPGKYGDSDGREWNEMEGLKF